MMTLSKRFVGVPIATLVFASVVAAGTERDRSRVLAEAHSEIVRAPWSGDFDVVRSGLAALPVHVRDELLVLLWESAVFTGEIEIARGLMEFTSAGGSVGDEKNSILELALALGRIEIADLLLEGGVTGVWSKGGYSRALERAVRWGLQTEVRAALQSGWETQDEVLPGLFLSEVMKRYGFHLDPSGGIARESSTEAESAAEAEVLPRVEIEGIRFYAPPNRPEWAHAELEVEVLVTRSGRTRMPRVRGSVERGLADHVERLADGLLVRREGDVIEAPARRMIVPIALERTDFKGRTSPDGAAPVILRGITPRAVKVSGRGKARAVLQFVVAPRGIVEEISVYEATHPRFGESAREAMSDWLFHPGVKAGRTVHTLMRLPFTMTPNAKDERAQQ
jgi:hypothetical protein